MTMVLTHAHLVQLFMVPKRLVWSHGWHVEGTMEGENWNELTKAYYRLLIENADPNIPKVVFARSREKGADITSLIMLVMALHIKEIQSCSGKPKKILQ
ncbi:MAG: hypothetical protein Ct9H300mP29_0990 [Candidatus Neomarinimicrobiota bacterium]|nr:MAG: hypothetical protein Ct9H300mP29_0990 [Candidatus Neomarinimicrobiota bacterium]